MTDVVRPVVDTLKFYAETLGITILLVEYVG